MSRGKRILLFVALALSVWGVALIYVFVAAPPAGDSADAGNEINERVEPLKVDYGVPSTAPKDVAAASDNVFVGEVGQVVGLEVVKNTSSRPGNRGKPMTRFAVTVVEPLKSGGAQPAEKGTSLTVGQFGGTMDGKEYPIVGMIAERAYADRPLEPGKEYLFSTMYNEGRGYQEITVQPHGNVVLDGSEPAAREEMLDSFRRAIREAASGDPSTDAAGQAGA
ncbi:hypothetical protein GBA65_21735 (plasmid) [Rubrobacter marinus]|uniref:Uncharacterized protein n=1 Tax=Rubrobacter marinus TaxID=2653852 RepID=A0A6G8Q3L6_9ACTN|nr:hypothetical protein [Rubrobacter marinus]QIN81062.1 hypothetical protein GBA65_21735 [Rubrobacter marinus]